MHPKTLAPVVLFVYSRPQHTAQAINSLKQNPLAEDTVLYIYADGPKMDASKEDLQNIKATRELIKKISGFKQINIIEKDQNAGLASSIIAGVTEIINKHGSIIVLEDDLIVSPYFLDYMNAGLETYKNSQQVYSINGFMFPVKYKKNQVVLLPYTSTWGWATWKNKWNIFDEKMKGKELLLSDKAQVEKFNLGDYRYTDMLHFENNSWGIKWYYSVFMKKGLNLFPTNSLVINTGFDGSGTNCVEGSIPTTTFSQHKIDVSDISEVDPLFLKTYINYFKADKPQIFLRKILGYFRSNKNPG